jgi:hypothetical protein
MNKNSILSVFSREKGITLEARWKKVSENQTDNSHVRKIQQRFF